MNTKIDNLTQPSLEQLEKVNSGVNRKAVETATLDKITKSNLRKFI